MASDLDWNDMLIFAQVADSKGFTAAARVLDMPKSTVSRRIGELESALGVRLLQRTTRRLSLTDVGAAYAERCRAVRAEIEEATLAVTSAGESPRGRLRVTAPVEIGRGYLSPVIAEYGRRYPEVEIEIEFSDFRRDLVAEGFDVALRVGELEDSTLIARRLGPTETHVFASPAYIEANGEPRVPSEITDHDTIVMTSGIGGYVWRFQQAEGPIEITVAPRITANDFKAVTEMALAGLGLARLPSWVAAPHVREGRLRRLLGTFPAFELGVFAVYPTRRHLSAKVKRFLELLEDQMKPIPWLLEVE
ncbi:MAG: LysR family transcriptional regulator [Myxococcota bacterium]